jgi:glucose/mannose-6-phosphate isomerase
MQRREYDLEELGRTLDRSRMADVIRGIPRQISMAMEPQIPKLANKNYRNAIVAGVGGSALPAEVMIDCFRGQISRPISVHRGYGLPAEFNPEALLLCCSFSGNTEETLDVVRSVPPEAANVVTFGAGGELESVSRERGFPFVRIPLEHEPDNFQPRCATGYFVTLMSRLLGGTCLPDDASAQLATAAKRVDEAEIRPGAEGCALFIANRIPIVYTDEAHTGAVARVGKIKFNENSKRPAFFNALPELNHNEMTGFVHPLGEYCVLYLHDPESDPRIRKRFETMRRVFDLEGIANVVFFDWEMLGSSRMERVLTSLSFLDWCSYTLALISGFDPTPVDLVEKFKREIAAGPAARQVRFE